MQEIRFTKAYLRDQYQDHWKHDVTLLINDQGIISAVTNTGEETAETDVEVIDGYVIPGMTNIHSHAFQRAMAGLAEYTTSGQDNFWTWRDVMYRFAQNLSPEDLYHIARQLYLEMMQAGYTSVAEFHYLHHQKGGQAYADPTEMSKAILRAADDVGIHLTLLPVLYMTSGFGGATLNDQQARFAHNIDDYCHLLDSLNKHIKGTPHRLGAAFHSLRAVPPEAMNSVVQHMNRLDATAPLHIHIAEQVKEVEDCMEWSGQRPVEWLLNHQNLNHKWCLIHATHMTEKETTDLAKSGAVAGLCPTTEANLGDGLFPLKSFLVQGGHMAIGSDSHISVNPVEELRLLEYGQRLTYQRRNIVASDQQPHTGNRLYGEALRGGAYATGVKTGVIEVGSRADLVVLDPTSPLLVGTPNRYLLDRYIFSGNQKSVRDVMVGGKWVVQAHHHTKQEEITKSFRNTMEKLAQYIA